jgi:hypothetical protein
MRRHRAEACDRLALADVRPLVEPGAAAAALLLACPVCNRSARVLWRPLAAPGSAARGQALLGPDNGTSSPLASHRRKAGTLHFPATAMKSLQKNNSYSHTFLLPE